MQLNIYKETTERVPAKKIRALFELVAEREAEPHWQGQINLIFTHDRRIQKLNKEHRGIQRPTDVLSFNIEPPDGADNIFGEVYISTDTAVRQAKRFGHSLAYEFLHLACHGFMHLYGYDHQVDTEAALMEAREATYLRQISGE